MEQLQDEGLDLRGVLAAAWIGCLGGLFVGALGQGETLMPGGYYADGTVYGFIGGAVVGALVGLVAGAALVRRLGNGRTALLGGILGIFGAAAYGLFAFPLADTVEPTFLQDPWIGGLLGGLLFAAVGGALASALVSGSPDTGRRAAVRDLMAGGILGAFLGLFGGGFAEVMTTAWASPSVTSPGGTNVGLFFGFYLGAGVGAGVSFLVGAVVRRWRAKRPHGGNPSS